MARRFRSFLLKERFQAARDLRSDLADLLVGRAVSSHDGLERAEAAGQHTGDVLADLADVQSHQEALKRDVLAALAGGVDEQETLWTRPDGVARSLEGAPYHEGCAPAPLADGPHGCDH